MDERFCGRQAHQAVLMELWTVFDAICQKHNIPYMLFAGSALGAVRHGKIIPWDDDLDVVMLRPAYERFLKAAKQDLAPQYFLQAEYSEHWPMFFTKLRKNNTACMERFVPKDKQMHQGIYLDVFPCDNLSDRKLVRCLQFVASKIAIAKALDARGYLTDSMSKRLFMVVCRAIPLQPLLRFVQMKHRPNTQWVHTFFGGAKRYEKNIYPRAWFEETMYVPFGSRSAPVSGYSDALLTKLYGDYMTPMPEAERALKVHADIVDTQNSYEQYLEMQEKQKIHVHTRSVR